MRACSVGVLELGPVRALPEAIELAKAFGVDISGHRAKDIGKLSLERFDLVLGFEQMHVRTAVVDAAARVDRTFTLPELVGLLEAVSRPASEGDTVERAAARVAQASESRPPGFTAASILELPDPLGRPAREQRRVAEELRELIRRLAQLLFG